MAPKVHSFFTSVQKTLKCVIRITRTNNKINISCHHHAFKNGKIKFKKKLLYKFYAKGTKKPFTPHTRSHILIHIMIYQLKEDEPQKNDTRSETHKTSKK